MNEEERKYQFFVLMLKAVDVVYEYAKRDEGPHEMIPLSRIGYHRFRELLSTPVDPVLKRCFEIDPRFRQTEAGLFLEFDRGIPFALWTPWGWFRFRGDAWGNWEKLNPTILQRLGTTFFDKVEGTLPLGGIFADPVYAVHQIDGIKLPEPVLREADDFISYDQAKKEWREMMARYLREKSKTSIPPLESGKAMPNLQKSPNWDLRKDVKIFSNEGYPFCEGWPSCFGRIDKIFELILWTGVRHFAFVDPSFQYQADGLTWRSVRTRERIERYNVIAWQEVDPDDVRLK